MNNPLIIPDLDALPLPGPVWIFKLLLHLTFVLHLVAMNLLLGGAIIALVERLRGHGGSGALARAIEKRLPPIMAFAVTLGVAPLLFLQSMYGHLFYTSSVLMAWPWFMVVPIVIVVYYGCYAMAFRGGSSGVRIFNWVAAVGLLGVATIYVNNMSLAIRPESWGGMYLANPRGLWGNGGDPTVIPRFLHFVLAAMAVAGLAVTLWGALRWQRGEEVGRAWFSTGRRWFLIPTILQLLVGSWFLMALPKPVWKQFFGPDPVGSALLILGILAATASVLTMILAGRTERPLRWTSISVALLAATVVFMVLVRDGVRDAMLRPHFELSSLPIQPQWPVLGIFAVLFVMGLATLFWMVKIFFGAGQRR